MEKIINTESLELNVPHKAVLKNGKEVVIYKNSTAIFVFDNCCPHENYPLSEGEYLDNIVTCTKHGASFDMKNGNALTPPAIDKIRIYKTKIIENYLYVIN